MQNPSRSNNAIFSLSIGLTPFTPAPSEIKNPASDREFLPFHMLAFVPYRHFSVLPEQSPESVSVRFPALLFLKSHPPDTDSSVLPELPSKDATLFHAPGS